MNDVVEKRRPKREKYSTAKEIWSKLNRKKKDTERK